MHVWKDKEGNKLTAKEFITRWKEGIEKVSAMDKVKMSIIFSWIVLIGVIIGIISTFLIGTWWLVIILVGALGLNIVSILGIYQQYYTYKKIEEMLKEPQEPKPINQEEIKDVMF